MAAVTALAAAGCGRETLDQMDEIYYRWDHRRVVCAAGLDNNSDNDLASITRGLERARDTGTVIGLYTHIPGFTVPWEKLEAVIAKADELGLDFITYPELEGDPPRRGAVLLSFDDAAVEAWTQARPIFQAHGVKATFFVTRYHIWTPEQKAMLKQLAADGHAIEAHAVNHLRAPEYVIEHGLDAYLRDEIVPSIERLRADGFTPTVFAYPYGKRTGETDAAILKHVDRVRSISFSFGGVVTDPCPE